MTNEQETLDTLWRGWVRKLLRLRVIVPIIILLLVLWVPCGWPQVYYMQLRAAMPKYDALNEAVLMEIGTPEQVTLIDIRSGGIDPANYTHGRILWVDYETERYKQDILDFYDQKLTSDGWQLWRRSSGKPLYIRDSACLEISLDQYEPRYSLRIWHDYESQPFSPWQPPFEVLVVYNLFQINLVECP